MRENATRVRFTAFNCSSTPMKMRSALGRTSTPAEPIANKIAESSKK